MSEQTPQSATTQALPHKRNWKLIVGGTAALAVIAVIGFQFFRANPAASQTGSPEAGRATLGGGSNAQILAKVNNQAITYDVVARECVERYGEEVLDNLINRLIIQQECEKRGLTVTKAEIEEEVIETAKKFKLPLDTWYQMLAAERGLTRDQYHDDIIWPMLALKKLAGQQIEVTEADMKNGFERDYGPRVKARLILINSNIRNANQIWEEAKAKPEQFDELAIKYSADPNTRPLGGVIPPIRKNAGNDPGSKAIEDVAFKLQPGQISPVVQIGENRYVILKCEGQTEPVVTDIKEVWNVLYGQLIEEKTQTAVAKVFEKIKDDARVDNYLTRTTTGGRPAIQQTSGVKTPSPAQTAGGQLPLTR
ncbi:MAG: peptidylprolyl isomerase [Planctomycetaceae bacterium]|nr:peptidylprolyl isomerase [Planctomycetaceae bacterium]